MKFNHLNLAFALSAICVDTKTAEFCSTQKTTSYQKTLTQFVYNSGWGLGCAGIAYLGQKAFTSSIPSKKYCAYAGVAGLGVKYFYDYWNTPYTDEQLLELVIKNPQKALTYINGKNKGVTKADSFDKALIAHQKIEKCCPISLLQECVAEDWGACMLSRSYNPKFRNTLETTAVAALIEKSKNEAPTPYVGFGSGGMFQDFVIIAKNTKTKSYCKPYH